MTGVHGSTKRATSAKLMATTNTATTTKNTDRTEVKTGATTAAVFPKRRIDHQ